MAITLFDTLDNKHAQARGYKTFFMLNKTEHEISTACKNKNLHK